MGCYRTGGVGDYVVWTIGRVALNDGFWFGWMCWICLGFGVWLLACLLTCGTWV